MPAGTGDVVQAAVEEDLDAAAALAVLRRGESDGSIAAGPRFEIFAYADRLLGLDPARDIGRRQS